MPAWRRIQERRTSTLRDERVLAFLETLPRERLSGCFVLTARCSAQPVKHWLPYAMELWRSCETIRIISGQPQRAAIASLICSHGRDAGAGLGEVAVTAGQLQGCRQRESGRPDQADEREKSE